ncbi:MAG: diguanylate cyclase [Alphaproteobacteria bacterium]|nr:diguanylate cyclase [Alphaproteobacteria bacterium]
MEMQALTGSLAFAISQSSVALVMFGLYLAARRDLCTRYWAIASSLVVCGVALPFAFLSTPLRMPAVWLGATSIVTGVVWMWWGTRVFYGRPHRPSGWWLIGMTSALLGYSIYADATVMRVIVFASGVSTAIALLVREVWRGDGVPLTVARKLVILAVGLGAASLATRAAVMAALGSGGYAYTNGTFNVMLLYMLPMTASLLCSVGMLLVYFERTIAQKEYLANQDELTRLFNRRALTESGVRALSESVRRGKPFSVLLVDIDHFKSVNDSLGHEAGDAVLRDVAAALAANCRRTDVIGRYGGEEFCVVCPDTDAEAAERLGDRLIGAVAGTGAPPGAPRDLSISVGIATLAAGPRPPAWDALLGQADAALYAAKRAGRGRAMTAA